VDGAIFRAMTDDNQLFAAMAEFATQFNEAASFVLIGDPSTYGADLAEFETFIQQNDAAATVQIIENGSPTAEEITQIANSAPQVITYRGELTGFQDLLNNLANNGWTGVVVYDRAFEAAQTGIVTFHAGIQIVGVEPWVNSLDDPLSMAFKDSYVDRTGQAPDAVAVSAYDVTWALRLLVERHGADAATLTRLLATTDVIRTTQGVIDPAAYGGTDLFRSAVIYELLPLGGTRMLGRYDAGVLVIDEELAASIPTPTLPASATPSVATVTVTSNVLNVRSGPGLNYDRLYQLRGGDQATVVGTVPDFSWYYVQTTRGLGWVMAQYITIFTPDNNLAAIAQVPIPPTPTPAPTSTAATPPDVVIDSVTVSPSRPIVGQPFTASVTVRNAGGMPANNFAVAASWQPGEIFTAERIEQLNPAETVTLALTATLTGSGTATVVVVGDLNNEVAESNEENNNFTINYVADAQTSASSTGSYTAPVTITLGGASPDFDWSGSAFNAQPGSTVQQINTPFENTYVGLLTSGAVTGSSVATTTPGTVIGFRTAEGDCGFFRIDTISGSTANITYRVYPAASCPA